MNEKRWEPSKRRKEKHWEPSKRSKARSRDINETVCLRFAIGVFEDFAVEVESEYF